MRDYTDVETYKDAEITTIERMAAVLWAHDVKPEALLHFVSADHLTKEKYINIALAAYRVANPLPKRIIDNLTSLVAEVCKAHKANSEATKKLLDAVQDRDHGLHHAGVALLDTQPRLQEASTKYAEYVRSSGASLSEDATETEHTLRSEWDEARLVTEAAHSDFLKWCNFTYDLSPS